MKVRTQRIKNSILFLVIFGIVLILFILWYRIFSPTKHIADDITITATPVVRVGVGHSFLANLVKEIGGMYVSVANIKEPSGIVESASDVCGDSVVLFGLNATHDGWLQELCGSNGEKTAVVFLDTYIGTTDQESTTTQKLFSGTDKGYYWMTTQGGKDMARIVAKILSEFDPVHKVSYLDAAYNIAYQLDTVYGSVKDKMYNLRVSPVIVWGYGWQGVVGEYEGKIIKTIDTVQNNQEREATLKQIAEDLKKNKRMVVLGDLSLPFEDLKKLYRDGTRRVVILDPWGDFSDVWPYKVFVEQNLLRMTQAL